MRRKQNGTPRFKQNRLRGRVGDLAITFRRNDRKITIAGILGRSEGNFFLRLLAKDGAEAYLGILRRYFEGMKQCFGIGPADVSFLGDKLKYRPIEPESMQDRRRVILRIAAGGGRPAP